MRKRDFVDYVLHLTALVCIWVGVVLGTGATVVVVWRVLGGGGR